MKLFTAFAGALVVAGSGLLAGAAAAATLTPGLTLADTTGQQLGNGPYTLGFEFQANAEVKVGQLGVFDDAQIVPRRQIEQRVHVHGVAVDMDRHDGAGTL